MESQRDGAAAYGHSAPPPTLEDLHAEMGEMKDTMRAALEESRVSALCCQRMEQSYRRLFGDSDAEQWARQFSGRIVDAVRAEVRLPTTPGGHDGVTARAREQQFVMMEALRARCSAVEQRQASMEGKVNALVSDLVFSTQTIRNDMNAFAGKILRQLSVHKEEVRELLLHHHNRHQHIPPTDVAPLPPPKSEEHTVDERMWEMIRVLALLKGRAEEDHDEFVEWQASSFDMSSRLAARVLSVADDLKCVQRDLDTLRLDVDASVTGIVGEVANCRHAIHTLAAEHVSLRDGAQRLEARLLHAEGAATADGCPRRHWHAAAALLQPRHTTLLRARYFHTWLSWWTGRDRLRRDHVLLSLFRKHQEQMDDLQRDLGAVSSFNEPPTTTATVVAICPAAAPSPISAAKSFDQLVAMRPPPRARKNDLVGE